MVTTGLPGGEDMVPASLSGWCAPVRARAPWSPAGTTRPVEAARWPRFRMPPRQRPRRRFPRLQQFINVYAINIHSVFGFRFPRIDDSDHLPGRLGDDFWFVGGGESAARLDIREQKPTVLQNLKLAERRRDRRHIGRGAPASRQPCGSHDGNRHSDGAGAQSGRHEDSLTGAPRFASRGPRHGNRGKISAGSLRRWCLTSSAD